MEFEKSKFLELKKIKENLNLLSVSGNLKLMEITRRLFNDGKLLRPMVGGAVGSNSVLLRTSTAH